MRNVTALKLKYAGEIIERPLVIKSKDKSSFVVLSGVNRVRVAKELGVKKISCVMVPQVI